MEHKNQTEEFQWQLHFSAQEDGSRCAQLDKAAVQQLGDQIYISPGTEHTLFVYRQQDYQQLTERYRALPPQKAKHFRILFASFQPCDISQGILSVSKGLFEFSAIQADAVLEFVQEQWRIRAAAGCGKSGEKTLRSGESLV